MCWVGSGQLMGWVGSSHRKLTHGHLWYDEQAQSEASSWRQKYDAAVAAAESDEADELSSKRRKQMLTARVSECESQLAAAAAKTAALDKMKHQLQLDAESLIVQLDKVHARCYSATPDTIELSCLAVRIGFPATQDCRRQKS